MAEKKRDSNVNTVNIRGFLKENTLEQVVNTNGDRVIRGALLIATDALNAHKVQFYIPETKFNGEHSADFDRLLELLPSNTVSLASFLKDSNSIDFDTAANAATKVWAIGRFDEYATRSGERTTSMVTVKGMRAGLATADKGPFTPKAEFTTTIYINKMSPEQDEAENNTGRICIEGIVPKFKGNVDMIDFVAVTENGVADVVKANWHEGDTVKVEGDLISLAIRKKIEEDDGSTFGRTHAPQYETTFIRERRIVGGSKNPIKGDGEITKDMVREGLAIREEKMIENGLRAQKNSSRGFSANAAPASPAAANFPTGSGFPGGDDMDF